MERIKFKINGKQFSVGSEVPSTVTLLDFIRKGAELRGTKYMCLEGGCGACIVSVVKSPGDQATAINSCLVTVMSCHDWEITTIEKVGNKLNGYHPIQTTLADHHGTQCGHCSPGWVMSMYSLLSNEKQLSELEIERSLDSNLCRCTGYRPILDAGKTFAVKSPRLADIEDLKICNKRGIICSKSEGDCEDDEWCILSNADVDALSVTEIKLKDGKLWYIAQEISEVFNILRVKSDESYMLVAGNTAKGAYPMEEYPRILIDISRISELKQSYTDQNVVVGAGVTLTELLDIFEEKSKQQYFRYLKVFYDHLKVVAHTAVRNLGTIGGNLMIKHRHHDFPSDIFLLLETVGGVVTILFNENVKQKLSMKQFLEMNMKGKLIKNVVLPPLNEREYTVTTDKIRPRSQNSHAIVNSGFLFQLNSHNIVISSRIVYGGLSTNFTRARSTEISLIGKDLFKNETLQSAIEMLKAELIVEENPTEFSANYRKKLAIALFYKGLLSICPMEYVHPRYRSGAIKLRSARPVSKGSQIYDTRPSLYPLNQPIQKIEALIQCSGEAQYTDDHPSHTNEVYAAFVLSTIPKGTIVSIDPSPAMKIPGVIAFYSAKDIPGLNSFTPIDDPTNIANEEVLSSGIISYFNQPIGIIAAETQHIAKKAAKLVVVKYSDVRQPVTDVKKAKNDPNRVTFFKGIDATDKGSNVSHVIKGSNTIYGQGHFTMETILCLSRPTEEGLCVYSTTQNTDSVQLLISKALKIDQNSVDVEVRRIGGGFGLKVSRSTQVAVACSLVAYKLNKPCRFVMPITGNMKVFGKRCPCSADYEIAVDTKGVVQHLDFKLYEDNGFMINEQLLVFALTNYNNCYDASRWNYKTFNVVTDTAKNSWCRSPGTLENTAMVELIMENISYTLSMDPIDVRLANLDPSTASDVLQVINELKDNAQYTERKLSMINFNAGNRWKKRGIRVALLRWAHPFPRYFDVNLAVFHGDGSIIITHGGVEMGQGINTKAVQICAYMLKIPIDKIKIKANNTTFVPNAQVTGGSVTCQYICVGVHRCCVELITRLLPIRNIMGNATWEDIIKKAYEESIDLQTHGFVGAESVKEYNVYGATLSEVEIDVLTGEYEVLRVDIIEDVGQSVSPAIDIGQVEGAFVMGLGYWTSENLVYDKTSGELLTDRTWNYKIPSARDIPQDFRVYFKKNSYSFDLYFGSKSIGEPPICMAVSVPFAIREALSSARLESGIPTTNWFEINGPHTLEKVFLSACTNTRDYKFM